MYKTVAIKNKILGLLETSPDDKRLPSARTLASEFDVSFQFVQRVVDDLAERGLLKVFPRSGVEPHPYWRERMVNGVFRVHPADHWLIKELCVKINRDIPEIFISNEFDNAPMELSVSHCLISNHSKYCDLTAMLNNVVPDRRTIFGKILDAGRFGRDLCGIPLLFSPKVMILNRKIFEKCNCELPPENWTWDEFVKTLQCLGNKIEPFRTFGTWAGLTEWMNFVTVNGGYIFDPDNSNEVKIDAPEAIEALEFFRGLCKRAQLPQKYIGKYNHNDDFNRGNMAIYPGSRQTVSKLLTMQYFKKEDIVLRPMPVRERGMAPRSMLAANFFCVRKECVDMEMAQQLLGLLLSHECQNDVIGSSRCGIPIVSRAAQASFDNDDPHDAVFARTLFHVVPRYNITNPVSYHLVNRGIEAALTGQESEFKDKVKRVADALRMIVQFGLDKS